MLIGYARVSRDKQETALQLDALDKAGCQRVYVEKLSGASPERPELERCLDTLREGDTLIVWHLDRLGRSIKDLIERHCCKVSDEAAFCLIQRPYISKTLLTRRISPRGSP